ncbi:hypothetical protein ACWD3I_24095 [Streptomyces sp. NPDC002817]|uniref:hypothetical protein n=1 Tax=Streptomyces sp. NPDC088357 TaxID=3154655 RepID=UPI00341FB95D
MSDLHDQALRDGLAGESRYATGTAPHGSHGALTNGWDVVSGNCEFPQSSTWTWYESYATTGGASVSIGVNTKPSCKFTDQLSAEIGFSASCSWSWSKTHTLEQDVTSP